MRILVINTSRLLFYYPPDLGSLYTYRSYHTFKYFDITVTGSANQAITGRVWSKAWQFNCGPVQHPPTTSRFYGTMFILSDDSIVTSVNCNGFVGGTFSVSSNKTGCSTTGNIDVDRQSRTGFHTYPQYKIFLTDPDNVIFPTGKAQPGIILPILTNSRCETGAVDIAVKVDQDGLMEIFIEVNPNPGADPQDVTLTANVLAVPGGNGYNMIRWNGKDGQGKPVKHGTSVIATLRFIHGITHLPMYDIEFNDNGYKVDVIRPPGISPLIYWDDSMIPNGYTVNLSGCNDPTGCHLWDIEAGDTNTINSWWYVASSTAPAVTLTVLRGPGNLGNVIGEAAHCEGMVTKNYSIKADSNATAYIWSYTGTGVSLTCSGTNLSIDFSADATSGALSVSGSNADCGSGPVSTLPITIFSTPEVTLETFDSVCYNAPSFQLYGGAPPGGEYFIDGAITSTFDPLNAGQGSHFVIYRYKDSHGCINSDSSVLNIKTGRECEIVMWVPNAFTPDGDGLNDTFRPFSRNIREFSMNIYDRSGELVFTSMHPDMGWDGTFHGSICPPGTYVYIIVYRSPPSLPDNKILTGDVILVR
ncbi:MAG: gliding motility-associated C-terminal domain-containing protein [Bacteroidales bacterium]|nr:gliding motility-associated C-terminal domain-containing protein [Bacteroidales bacterium]